MYSSINIDGERKLNVLLVAEFLDSEVQRVLAGAFGLSAFQRR